MVNLEAFDGSDLKIVHALVMRFHNENSKQKKLFIIEKIDNEVGRVKDKILKQLAT